jgi:hypothetical protein
LGGTNQAEAIMVPFGSCWFGGLSSFRGKAKTLLMRKCSSEELFHAALRSRGAAVNRAVIDVL